MEEIQVGLIGFGIAGRVFHAPVIRAVPGLRLAAILQRSGNDASEAYPDVRTVRTVEEFLSDPQIRLVVIATPNRTHFEFARQCLLAGRDVVVDKPFTTTLDEARELIDVAKRGGRMVTVFQNRRWDGDFLTARRLVKDGSLGRLVLFESHIDRFRPEPRVNVWRERAEAGSGVLFDLAPHLLDQAMLLFGTPEAITADVRTEREGGAADDAFDVVLHYPNMRALLRASLMACAAGPRFVLRGSKGSYVKYGEDPQEDALKRGEIPESADWGGEAPQNWGTLSLAEGGAVNAMRIESESGDYRRYYENVRDALVSGVPLDVTQQHALNLMKALELCRASSRQGRTLAFTDVLASP